MLIESVLDAHAVIGESPTWVASESALYWIDVKAPALHRYEPGSGVTRTWHVSSDIGGFAFLESGDALVALRYGIHRLDLRSGTLTLLTPAPFDPALFRFNEAACDRHGRLWVGVMFDPIHAGPTAQAGRLHSFTLAGGLREEPDLAQLHNGMAWSADEHTFFLSHSNAGSVFAFDYEPGEGRLSRRRLFASIPSAQGIPDGGAVDTEGCYWSALHGGGKLVRFTASGSVDREIALPVSQPTMCCFAGPDMTTLYVTSASDQMSKEALRTEANAGNLLRLSVAVRGIPRSITVR